jgi:hypothetical protein
MDKMKPVINEAIDIIGLLNVAPIPDTPNSITAINIKIGGPYLRNAILARGGLMTASMWVILL